MNDRENWQDAFFKFATSKLDKNKEILKGRFV